MSTSSSRVSVIIPCFNLGRYLPEAIASVHRQTLAGAEILVVDDGSTEPETLEALTAAEPSVSRIVRSGNRGLSAARNLGIRHASGAYVCCLDADDVLDERWLEAGVARLDADPGLAFVSHWVEAFGDEQGEWTPGRSDLSALLDRNVFNGAALFRRELVDAVGGFDESMRHGCEDWEFWIRVMAAGHRGATIPAVLYRYRRRADSMSRAMIDTGAWFDLYGSIVDKHAGVFRGHLLDLILRREAAIAGLWHGIDGVREELATRLEPASRERVAELEHGRSRLERAGVEALPGRVVEPDALDALARELAAARAHVDALHRSWSWRITAPLRRAYEWVARPGRAGERR
jgi:glycosyltransferase involved in cell wall biosynthesis